MSDPVSVLLVDDHALVRRAFRHLLEDDPLITVVAEAGHGDQAIALAEQLKPRVIVMDYSMPGTGGLTAMHRILAQWPEATILVVSAHGEDAVVQQVLQAGARGYVRKDALDLDLAAIVKRVAAGETVVPPESSHVAATKGPAVPALSPRQREVLQLICDGLSYAAIAQRLNLSENTVAVHRAHIMKALQVHRSTELMAYAIRHGLVNLP